MSSLSLKLWLAQNDWQFFADKENFSKRLVERTPISVSSDSPFSETGERNFIFLFSKFEICFRIALGKNVTDTGHE